MKVIVEGKHGKVLREKEAQGTCKCGTLVCLKCQQAVEPGKVHRCGSDRAEDEMDEKTKALLGNLGKACPNCGTIVIHNGGCSIVRC